MPWVVRVKVVDGRDLVRYWSPDQDLIPERAGARKFTDLSAAVAVARSIERAGPGTFLTFVEKF